VVDSLKSSPWIITNTTTIIIIVVAIIVSFIFIIITFYYYNNQILHRPATGIDKFGIREIYATKSGVEEWFMNM
jgi:heme/copper-type cytochrome/quinol oxidase subunit 2